MKERIDNILTDSNYRVSVISSNKEQEICCVHYPYNRILFPKMSKSLEACYTIDRQDSIITFKSNFLETDHMIEVPEYLIRPIIDLDIKITCHYIKYNPNYIFYSKDLEGETYNHIIDILAPPKNKLELEESMFLIFDKLIKSNFPFGIHDMAHDQFVSQKSFLFSK